MQQCQTMVCCPGLCTLTRCWLSLKSAWPGKKILNTISSTWIKTSVNKSWIKKSGFCASTFFFLTRASSSGKIWLTFHLTDSLQCHRRNLASMPVSEKVCKESDNEPVCLGNCLVMQVPWSITLLLYNVICGVWSAPCTVPFVLLLINPLIISLFIDYWFVKSLQGYNKVCNVWGF